MKTLKALLLALSGLVLIPPSYAQLIPKGDVRLEDFGEDEILPPALPFEFDPVYEQYATINLDDAPDGYAVYKCVITNDVVRDWLPYLVYDLGWGVDVTRRFIYALIYAESRLDPYAVVENEPGNPLRNANGLLQIVQIMIEERKRIGGMPSFSASELSDRRLPPGDTYLRSLQVLNDMARAAQWDTPEKIASKWYCWNCPDVAMKNWRIGNVAKAYREFYELEWFGYACTFSCNTAPFRTVEP